jgi:hypothetical protein
MTTPSFDFKTRWARAASSMKTRGIDALSMMKPANLAYLTGDGRLATTAATALPDTTPYDHRTRWSTAAPRQ